jgi:hypothetical protein
VTQSLTLAEIVDAATAEVEAEYPVPTGDPGFGSDISCADDISATMDEVSGDSSLAVAQSNYRRLSTPRGTLSDDEDYGLDLRAFLAKAMTPEQIQAIEGQIRGELGTGKDDRNESIDEVSVTEITPAEFAVEIRGTTAAGPFRLTLNVTDSDVLLQEMVAG